MKQYPMTETGAETLRVELQRLKKIDRPKVIKAIAEARALGDLKENAEYHAAREQQSFIEGRIKDIEAKLSMAQIIDITKIPNQGKVIFGSTVTLLNADTNEEVTYQIVGHDEANINLGKISVGSPIARALIGKQEGDTADVQAPGGEISYEIISVEYI
ncbi:MAG: transcription elongation factor GreA [Gammaproteobacteria bacterium]|nr:transcription elongation factor GreA [Gammaproteobacteria bacterium]